MRKGFYARSYPAGAGFETMFDSLADAGFDCVELCLEEAGASAHSLSVGASGAVYAHVRRLSRMCGLRVAAVSCPLLDRTPLGASDKATRLRARETLLRLVEAAIELDAPQLIVSLRGDVGAMPSESRRRAMETMQRLFIEPDARFLSVLLENEPNGLFLAPYEAAVFFDQFPLPGIGFCFNGDDVPPSARSRNWPATLRGRIGCVRVGGRSGSSAPAILGVDSSWRGIMRGLTAAGYAGALVARCAVRSPADVRAASEALDQLLEPDFPGGAASRGAVEAPGVEPSDLLDMLL